MHGTRGVPSPAPPRMTSSVPLTSLLRHRRGGTSQCGEGHHGVPQVPPRHVYLMIPPKLFAEEDGGIDCVCDDGDGAERGDKGGRCKTVSSKVPDLAKNHQRNSFRSPLECAYRCRFKPRVVMRFPTTAIRIPSGMLSSRSDWMFLNSSDISPKAPGKSPAPRNQTHQLSSVRFRRFKPATGEIVPAPGAVLDRIDSSSSKLSGVMWEFR